MEAYFDFETPIVELERKLRDLRELARQEEVDFSEEIAILQTKVDKLIDETYSNLSPWQKVQLSRHPSRPYTRDYLDLLFPNFMELHGDRFFADDTAVIGGVASWPPAIPSSTPEQASQLPQEQMSVMVIGHQKGRTTKQKMEHCFGMAKPEGYRKAMRLMELADRAKMPIITLIDTPGAYPGIEAEERGQAQAIAESIRFMFGLKVPVLAIIIGEGGSGGALALGIGNRVLMQEYSIYSVISPESCASILWSDSSLAERASQKLKMSPTELHKLGVIDGIIPEPKGGAHRAWNQAALLMREAMEQHFGPLLENWPGGHAENAPANLSRERVAKFRAMGNLAIVEAPATESSS